MALVTLRTFSERIGATYMTIATWCDRGLSQFDPRPKDTAFRYKMIWFVIIDGKRFVDTEKTRLTKKMYKELFKRDASK